MQTFITYLPTLETEAPFEATARSLDYRRLGKQRVEAKQILMALLEMTPKRGWANHTATRMWRGYEDVLCVYALDICDEWRRRGYNDSLTPWFEGLLDFLQTETPLRMTVPAWLQGEAGDAFVTSHRSNLIRKDAAHYAPQWPGTPADLPYVWPV